MYHVRNIFGAVLPDRQWPRAGPPKTLEVRYQAMRLRRRDSWVLNTWMWVMNSGIAEEGAPGVAVALQRHLEGSLSNRPVARRADPWVTHHLSHLVGVSSCRMCGAKCGITCARPLTPPQHALGVHCDTNCKHFVAARVLNAAEAQTIHVSSSTWLAFLDADPLEGLFTARR